MLLHDIACGQYTRRLRARLDPALLPRHVGLIMDGNRRWARRAQLAHVGLGHRQGAERVEEFLSWCENLGISHVTLFVCSTENLLRRSPEEVGFLMQLIEEVAVMKLAEPDPGWQVHVAGTLDVLPDSTNRALKETVEATRQCGTGRHLTLAIGYGGRQEVVEALRSLLYEKADSDVPLESLASTLNTSDIERHLFTAGRPDPDLVIRTSGEQRLSNFLLWQSTDAELYFCETYWPAFREIDFLRALRNFAARRRASSST